MAVSDAARPVDIAIPTYDGRRLLNACLPSVVAQDPAPARTVVVDDGSCDGTPEYLRERWPTVEVLVQAENRGVAATLNAAVLATSGEYVALVNNDVELAPGWLGELVATLDAHPEAASACGKLLDYTQRGVLDGAGDTLHWSGAGGRRGHGEIDRGQYDEPEEVIGACGGAALYRRSALEDVGAFDERYEAYYEDVDWSLRAQLLGWRCRYQPTAVAFHMGSATTQPQHNLRYWRLQRRNLPLLVAKCFPAAVLSRQGHRIVGFQLLWLAHSARVGLLATHLGALGDAARLLPAFLRARRELQRRTRVSLRELAPLIGKAG